MSLASEVVRQMKRSEIPGIPQLTKTQELVYELRVVEAMKVHVFTITPEQTMEDVRNLLRDKRISGLPVLEGDNLVGIISIEDLLKCLREGKINDKVKDRMTRNIVTVYADEPLTSAINRFGVHGFGRFPVIDRQSRKLLGIITKGDIIRCLLSRLEVSHRDEEISRYRAGHLFEDIVSDRSVLELRYRVAGSDFQKAGEQSSKLKKNLLRLGVPPEEARRITIASYEAEMNIVVFTPGGELIAHIEPEKVTVTAVDQGPGIPDINLAMQPGYSTAPDWVRELGFGAGMGLPNIKNCTDEMNLKSEPGKGTNLEFTVITRQ